MNHKTIVLMIGSVVALTGLQASASLVGDDIEIYFEYFVAELVDEASAMVIDPGVEADFDVIGATISIDPGFPRWRWEEGSVILRLAL